MSEYKLPLDKLLPALIKFQGECPAIVKDKENSFITEKNKGKKAMYADLAAINETIKTPLSSNNLAITQPISGNILQTYLYHSSGQFIKSEVTLSIDAKTSQQIGSEITYMRRYALCAILGIAADDDDDGNSASKTTPAASNPPASTTTPPKPETPLQQDPAQPMASEAQRRKIDALRSECGWSVEDTQAELALKFKVKSSKELTLVQAKGLIDLLEKNKGREKDKCRRHHGN